MHPSSPSPRLSVILPVHNQQDHIGRILTDYLSMLETLGQTFEIVCVVNASSDDSARICRELAAQDKPLRIVETDEAGWGRSVRRGLREAQGSVLCYTNSSRTTAEELRLTLELQMNHPESAVKARRTVRQGFLRRIGSGLYNLESRVLFRIRSRDINGTPKVFSRSMTTLMNLQEDGDLIDLEFAVRARRAGIPVVEAPIAQTQRAGGRSTTNWKTARGLLLGALAARLGRANKGWRD